MRFSHALDVLSTKPSRTVIGLISGTSADGIDAAAVRISGAGGDARVDVLAVQTTPYPPGLPERLFALTASGSAREVCALNVEVGELFAEAAAALMARVGGADLIGSHGQTVYHIPPEAGGPPGSTLQIGEPAVIAEQTGVPTVAHFRPRDMAAGGMGAPLVSYADWVLFRDATRTRLAQNIGGIANVTVLPAGGGLGDVFAFDTGPGNMVIDAMAGAVLEQSRDDRGTAAARGRVDPEFLAFLLQDGFITASPPKTTGRERYGREYARPLTAEVAARDLDPDDAMATVTALTVESIAVNYERFVYPRHDVDEVIVSGGGVHNGALMDGLRRRLAPRRVATTADFGIDPDAKEAVAFALLANDALMGLPTNVPGATGARRAVVLGAFFPGHADA